MALGVVVPSPSWPLTLDPQQYPTPPVVTPQVETGAGAHGREGQLAGDGYRRRGLGRRPVTELTLVVFPPAIGDPVRRDAAAVTATRARRCERECPRDGHRGGAVCRRAVAELAEEAAPPAVGDAVRGKGAGVTVPGAEDLERQAAGDRHRRRAVRAQAAAELAADVASPAVGRSAGREAAGVLKARAHYLEAESARDGRRDQALIGRAVAGPPGLVRPPPARAAVGCAVRREAAGVPGARAQHREYEWRARRRGLGAGGKHEPAYPQGNEGPVSQPRPPSRGLQESSSPGSQKSRGRAF